MVGIRLNCLSFRSVENTSIHNANKSGLQGSVTELDQLLINDKDVLLAEKVEFYTYILFVAPGDHFKYFMFIYFL